MKPVAFPEQTRVWVGAPGSEVRELPAFTDDRVTISCWELSWSERMILLLTGRVWLSQLNFTRPLQPQKASVRSPFETQVSA